MILSQTFAPIKLNLNLHVVGINEKNYHLLQGVTVFTNYGDILTIEINNQNDDALIIQGQFSDLLKTENASDNLIIKAIKSLRSYKNFPFITITLEKNIPIQAGYGGGSSDAAAVLKYLNHIFELNLDFKMLLLIGQSLGADIPMCLYAIPCFIENIGDVITPLPLQGKTYFCLLLKPCFNLATKDVFNALSNKQNPAMPKTDNFMDYAIYHGRNDLWQVACSLKPELYDYLNALNSTNPIKATMSGSGSGLFALYYTQHELDNAYDVIAKKFPNNFIKKTFFNQ